QVAVTCTKYLDPCHVGIDNGGSPAGGRRGTTNGGNRLEHDIYKDEMCGACGPDGAARVTTPAAANSPTHQQFSYTARIYADEDTPPSGAYTDALVVEVSIDP